MKDIIDKTEIFLLDTLKASQHDSEKIRYRFEHSLRVANIALELAESEKAHKEIVIIASLLHDCGKFHSEKGIDHGRKSAELARPFLESLQLTNHMVDDICYAVACHVDGQAGYPYTNTLEALVVFDADKIDRLSTSKCLNDLNKYIKSDLSVIEKIKTAEHQINKLQNQMKVNHLKTIAGTQRVKNKLIFQVHLYESWLKDLKLSQTPIL